MKKIAKTYKTRIKNRLIFMPDKESKKYYKEINDEIVRKYHLELNDRTTIIKTIINVLTQGDPQFSKLSDAELVIIRTDIKNFYPSINKHDLYKKISNSNLLKRETLETVSSLMFNKNIEGIPLGFPFSNSLAELYLEDFDTEIYMKFSPVYYFRYIDDIIIIINYLADGSAGEDVFKQKSNQLLDDIFGKYSLSRNIEKTQITFTSGSNDFSFDYLGYCFTKYRLQNDPKLSEILKISITKEKYVKLIKQLEGYFYSYNVSSRTNSDFWLLYFRIKNRIYGVTADQSKRLKYGLGFTYSFVNDKQVINKIIDSIIYRIRQLNLSANKKNTLLSLIKYDNSCLEILDRRYNYNNTSDDKVKKICKKIGIAPVYTRNTNLIHFFKKIKI